MTVPELSLLAAFLTGLLGVAHCAGMCGGIVTAISLQGSSPHAPRHPFRFLLAYNAGRLTSYTVAGALVGMLGSATFLSGTLLPLQKGLYFVAQLVLILLGLYLAGLNQSILKLEKAGGFVWRRIQPRLGTLIPLRTARQALLAGALWGWLPCGLVYSVLVSALAAGSTARGALLMLTFGLGTLPGLLLMGWAAESLRTLTQTLWIRRLAGALVAGLGLWGLGQLAFA